MSSFFHILFCASNCRAPFSVYFHITGNEADQTNDRCSDTDHILRWYDIDWSQTHERQQHYKKRPVDHFHHIIVFIHCIFSLSFTAPGICIWWAHDTRSSITDMSHDWPNWPNWPQLTCWYPCRRKQPLPAGDNAQDTVVKRGPHGVCWTCKEISVRRRPVPEQQWRRVEDYRTRMKKGWGGNENGKKS